MKTALLFSFMFLLFSCRSTSPLQGLQKELDQYPEYSVILEDMKEEGAIFSDYYHRYKVVYAEPQASSDSLLYKNYITDWERVDKREYQDKYNYLGMAIISKSQDDGVSDSPYPPGYQYVGNPRYGQWRQDSRGNSFWEFYGKWAFFSTIFGTFNRPIYRGDWDDYRGYRRSGRPYYGRNNEYGTQGKYTKQTHKSFFERRTAREAARKSRFSNKVSSRVRRSSGSKFRSRSSGFGK